MSCKNSTKLSTPDPDLAKWCAALATEVVADEVPPGWHTAKQIAAATGKAHSTTGAQLCRAVSEGRCERKLFRVQTGDMVRPVPHYKLK